MARIFNSLSSNEVDDGNGRGLRLCEPEEREETSRCLIVLHFQLLQEHSLFLRSCKKITCNLLRFKHKFGLTAHAAQLLEFSTSALSCLACTITKVAVLLHRITTSRH